MNCAECGRKANTKNTDLCRFCLRKKIIHDNPIEPPAIHEERGRKTLRWPSAPWQDDDDFEDESDE